MESARGKTSGKRRIDRSELGARRKDVEDRCLRFRGISDRLAVSGGRFTASVLSGESTTWEYTSPRITPPLRIRFGLARSRGARSAQGNTERQRVHVNAAPRVISRACASSKRRARARGRTKQANEASGDPPRISIHFSLAVVRDLVSPRHYSPSLFIGAPRHAEVAITNLEARPSRAKSLGSTAESRPLSLPALLFDSLITRRTVARPRENERTTSWIMPCTDTMCVYSRLGKSVNHPDAIFCGQIHPLRTLHFICNWFDFRKFTRSCSFFRYRCYEF